MCMGMPLAGCGGYTLHGATGGGAGSIGLAEMSLRGEGEGQEAGAEGCAVWRRRGRGVAEPRFSAHLHISC